MSHHRRKSSLTIGYQDFTDEEMEELQRDFNRYDTNGDGQLTIEEYRQAARDLELNFIPLDHFDADGDGEIDFFEFLDMVNTNLQISHMKKKFMEMDQDGNGLLTKKELRDGLKVQGFLVTENDLNEIFSQVDVDNNGEIDISEFLDMLSRGLHDKLKRVK